MRYVETLVGFSEVPDEITLCINISNCPNNCPNCHSPHLQTDIGKPLTKETLKELIEQNKGITCVCFMGGDSNPGTILELGHYVKQNFNIKTAWYSGKNSFPRLFSAFVDNFDYIKVGSYQEDKGPLNSKTTNQKMFQIINKQLKDITYKFQQ